MARKTAGERFEPDDPTIPVPAVKPKSAADLAAEEAAAVKAEKLPDNLKDAFALLHKLNAEPVSSREEWEAKQPRLRAIKKLCNKLQQGLPVCPPNANDYAAGWAQRLANEERQALEQLAVRMPAVRAMLDENDSLKKRISDLTSKK